MPDDRGSRPCAQLEPAVLGVMGDDDGPLLSASEAHGALEDPSAFEIRLGDASEETMAILRTAINLHRQVHIDYYSYGAINAASARSTPAGSFRRRPVVRGRLLPPARADRVSASTFVRQRCSTRFSTGRPIRRACSCSSGSRVPAGDHGLTAWVLDQYPHDEPIADDRWTRLRLPVAARADRTPARTSRSRGSCRRRRKTSDCGRNARGTYPRSIRQMTRQASRQDQSARSPVNDTPLKDRRSRRPSMGRQDIARARAHRSPEPAVVAPVVRPAAAHSDAQPAAVTASGAPTGPAPMTFAPGRRRRLPVRHCSAIAQQRGRLRRTRARARGRRGFGRLADGVEWIGVAAGAVIVALLSTRSSCRRSTAPRSRWNRRCTRTTASWSTSSAITSTTCGAAISSCSTSAQHGIE
jgi:hypothetical protein